EHQDRLLRREQIRRLLSGVLEDLVQGRRVGEPATQRRQPPETFLTSKISVDRDTWLRRGFVHRLPHDTRSPLASMSTGRTAASCVLPRIFTIRIVRRSGLSALHARKIKLSD